MTEISEMTKIISVIQERDLKYNSDSENNTKMCTAKYINMHNTILHVEWEMLNLE